MRMWSIFSTIIILGGMEAAIAAEIDCGAPPELSGLAEKTETTIKNLEGQADLLSKLVGKVELGGTVKTARKNIYQTSDLAIAEQKDRYLYYLFCIIVVHDKSIGAIEKIRALKEFRKPITGDLRGIITVIGGKYLYKNDPDWRFEAPAGAIVEAIGLNCPAVVKSGSIQTPIRDGGKAPIIGDDGETVPVFISFSPYETQCHGKFQVSAPR